MILDEDPRENVDALLDTKTHARFAIREGVIVKNELQAIPVSSADTAPTPRRWRAYTPPPIAVPIRYYDSRKWNKFETKPVSGLFIGALMLDRQFWLSQDSNSEDQVGDLSAFEEGYIRAFRFGVVGTLNFKRPWRYTVFATTHTFGKGFDVNTDDEFTWFDYRLDIPLPAGLMLAVGKQKEPISMERLASLPYLPMQERSAIADALMPARNHGVVLSGIAASDNVSWAVGAFNNWIDSDESFSDTTSQLVGRVTWAPAVFQNESNLLHFGLGLRYSDAKQPLRARSRPEFNNAPLYVDTGQLSADDQLTYNLEAYWRHGPYMVGFEYIGADVDSPQTGNPFFSGYHITGSWAVTGEIACLPQTQRDLRSATRGQTGQPGWMGCRRTRIPVLEHRPDRWDRGRRGDGHLFAGCQLVAHPECAFGCELPVYLAGPLGHPGGQLGNQRTANVDAGLR